MSYDSEHVSDYEHCPPNQAEKDEAEALLARREDARNSITAILATFWDDLDDAPARRQFDLNENAVLTPRQRTWLLNHHARPIQDAFDDALNQEPVKHAREVLGI